MAKNESKSRKRRVKFSPLVTKDHVMAMEERQATGCLGLYRRATYMTLTKSSEELRLLAMTDQTTYQHVLEFAIEHDKHLRSSLEMTGIAIARLAEAAKE